MLEIEEIKIENLIYEIRGKQVMLDSDLAKLYGCTNGTKDINKAVKRNMERFPEDFYFQLKKEEMNLWFQIGTANSNKMSRTLPHVFTEQGVAMLATVLKTENAAKVEAAKQCGVEVGNGEGSCSCTFKDGVGDDQGFQLEKKGHLILSAKTNF